MARVGDGADHIFVVLRNVFVVSAIRDHHRFVRRLILDELALAWLKNADDFVRDAIDLDGFPEWVHIRVQRLGDIGTNDGNVGAMHVFRVAEEPPGPRPGIENLFVRRERPVVIDPRHFLAAIARGHRPASRTFIFPTGIDAGRDRANRRAELSDGFGVFQGERLARAFIGSQPAGVDAGIEAEDKEGFRSVVGQIGVDVTVDAHEDRDYGKKSGDTDDHAEDREKGAHLVLTKSTERHPSVLADIHAHGDFHGLHNSWRKASMGCRLAARRAG